MINYCLDFDRMNSKKVAEISNNCASVSRWSISRRPLIVIESCKEAATKHATIAARQIFGIMVELFSLHLFYKMMSQARSKVSVDEYKRGPI